MDGSTREATLARTRCICCAYGRALMIRCCARRSLDAATIFIAFVICCVFLTARIRRRRSIREGICQEPASGFGLLASGWPGARSLESGAQSVRGCISGCTRSPCRKVTGEFLDRRVERRLQLIVELFLLLDSGENVRVPRLQEFV